MNLVDPFFYMTGYLMYITLIPRLSKPGTNWFQIPFIIVYKYLRYVSPYLTGRWRSCKRAFRSANGVAPVAAVGPTERTDRRNGRVSRARQIKIDRKREYCDLPRKRGELKRTARAYGNRRFRRANRNFTFAGRGKSSRRRLNISVPVRRRGPRGS